MTVLTLALLAGSQPAAPRLAPVHQIGPQSRRQSPHTPCAPLVRTDALTLTWQKADRHKRSAPTSSSHTPWPNPHSACGTAAAPLPAISCLGAFRPPAARARGEVRHCRQPKTCTPADKHVTLHGCARGYFWFHPPDFHFASGQISGTSLPLWVQGSTVQSSLVLRSLITAVLCGPSVNRNRNAGAAIV